MEVFQSTTERLRFMDATPALILTRHELRQLMADTAAEAATQAVTAMKSDLRSDPTERAISALRQYLEDRSTIANPRDHWANGHHIRGIQTNAKGKSKSMGWFMRFKRQSGLNQCVTRSSTQHGRLQEWTFEDIALCWDIYYSHR